MKDTLITTDRQRSPKYLQVVNAVISEIEGGSLRIGDRLPSINDACTDWYLSKDSVKRAYDTLSQLGLITSVYRKGYFIAGKSNRRIQRVLIITGQLTESVKQLHDAIVRQVGGKALIDICTYNYRQDLLGQLIDKHLGNYHYFLLMPHLVETNPASIQCLNNLPGNQLILVGSQWRNLLTHGHQIYYGGQKAFYEALESQLTVLRKYSQLNLVLPNLDFFEADYIQAFQQFCTRHDFNFQLLDELTEADICLHQAYFVTDSADLITLVDYSQQHALRLGQDLGVVSLTENEYTRLLAGGVSVISHPSAEVGRLVSQILVGQPGPSQPAYSLPLQLQFRASC
ncbi:GntR family transcriptional regulator [Spirosoma aureum]|uniref:GntR family transcriptional regulator n=1 Tax=Spirosoma aureum TaxID=2692134 RepID=A0A6G9AY59_9BACT|nr:GntR family transcriptional regulator [Spirosoma aureum]QIP17324.1 GntR family transcriptional regulator [Spirosoma aureum]